MNRKSIEQASEKIKCDRKGVKPITNIEKEGLMYGPGGFKGSMHGPGEFLIFVLLLKIYGTTNIRYFCNATQI